MYLNILNNISFENKRKSKKFINNNEEYLVKDEEKDMNVITKNLSCPYYSLFYGNLTNNWIKLKP